MNGPDELLALSVPVEMGSGTGGERRLLRPSPTAPRGRGPLRVHVQHVSLERTDTDSQFRSDVASALDRMAPGVVGARVAPFRPPADLTGFTEVNGPERLALLRRAAEVRGLQVIAPPDRGGLVIVARGGGGGGVILRKQDAEHVLAARRGAHTARPNLSAEFLFPSFDSVTYVVCHMVSGTSLTRRLRRVFQLRSLARAVRRAGRADGIAVWSADWNVDLGDRDGRRFYRLARRLGLRVASVELGHPEKPTHGNRQIDQLGWSARDSRVAGVDVHTWGQAHSDHRSKSMWIDIYPPGGGGRP